MTKRFPILLSLLAIVVCFVFSPTRIHAQALMPDLVIKSITFDAQNHATVVLENKGQAAALSATTVGNQNHAGGYGASVMLTYLKSDFHPNPSYIVLPHPQEFGVPRPFEPNTTFSVTGTNPISIGATHLRVTVDNSSEVYESDETNNTLVQILPTITPPSTLYSDLTVTGITFNSAGLPMVTITNNGPGEVYASRTQGSPNRYGVDHPYISVRYLRSNFAPNPTFAEIGTQETFGITNPFNPSATQTITGTKPIPASATHVNAVVDNENVIAEINEDNNAMRLVLPTVTPPSTTYSDLAIKSIDLDPATQLPMVSFTNLGLADVYAPTGTSNNQGHFGSFRPLGHITYLRSSFQAGNTLNEVSGGGENFAIPKPFAPGAMQTFIATLPIPDAATHFRVNLDYESSVMETDEGNNAQTYELPSGDLVIESLTKKDDTTAIMVIKNTGSLPLKLNGKSLLVAYNSGGQTAYKSFFVSDNLAPAGSVTFNLPVTANAAEMTATVDPDNTVPESNNGNNSISVKFFLETKTATDLVKEVNLGILNQIKLASPAATMPVVSAVTNIKALPCEPLYAVKQIGRSVEKALTFGAANKAKLDMAFANEKVIEGSVLAGQNKPDCAAKALDSATKDMVSANIQIEKLAKTASASAQVLATTAVTNQLASQQVTGVILNITPTANLAKITTARDNSLGTFAKSIEILGDSNKVKQALTITGKDTSGLGSLANLEVLTAVQDKLSPAKQTDILSVKDDAVTTVRQTLQSLPTDQASLFSDVVKATGGEDSNKLKVLDEVRLSGVTDEVRLNVLGAKDDVVKTFEDKIVAVAKDDPKSTDIILKDLADGSITDLRVLSEMSNSKDTLIDKSINEVKEESIKSFVGDSDQQDLAKDFADATQIQVIQDIKEIVPQDDVVQKLDESLRDEVKTNLDKEVTLPDQYDEFLGKFIGDDPADVKDVQEFTQGFDDKQLTADMLKAQIALLKDMYESADKDVQIDMQDEMFGDEDLTAIFEEYDPQYDAWQEEFNVDEEVPVDETVVDEPVDEVPVEDVPVDDALNPYQDNSEFTYDETQPVEEPEATPEETPEEEVLGASTQSPEQMVIVSPVLRWFESISQWLTSRN